MYLIEALLVTFRVLMNPLHQYHYHYNNELISLHFSSLCISFTYQDNLPTTTKQLN